MDRRSWIAAAAVVLAAACLVLTACEKEPQTASLPAVGSQKPAGTPQKSPGTQPGQQDFSAVRKMLNEAESSGSAAELPPGHPPIGPTGAPQTAPGAPGRPTMPATKMPARPPAEPGKPLEWDVPSAWKAVTPSTAMRKAQYEIPSGEGDEAPGEVTVFHFAGTGGTVDANIERWVGQFSDAEGKPVPLEQAKLDKFKVGNCTVHFVETTGYLTVGQSMGGTGERTSSEYRLLGGIVESPGGNWFFKATGPDKTMTAARDDFMSLLRSVRY